MSDANGSIFEGRTLDGGGLSSAWSDRLLPLVGVAGVVAAWWLGTHLSTGIIGMMTPERTAANLVELLSSRRFLAEDVTASLYRFAVALTLCVAVGLPAGLLVGYVRAAERLTTVVFQFLRIVSPIAWFPVAVAVLGAGTPAAVFVIFMAGVWPVVFNTAHGITTMDEDLITVGESLGGDQRALVRHVVLPAVLPDVLNGVRLAMGIGWIILVPAEMIGVDAGLGYTLLHARDRFAYGEIPAVILVVGTIGYVLDYGLRRLQDRAR
ncbi:MAG: ABC transporter permease [Halobacteriaceae archaeon]